ncbi:MAG: protein-L-isoaspartate(D-aspartate) O-methyltransferase [Candidatus Saganbacteria bacterium]|nr:protein-L-isoaspartate(D-aspartate) O-methyltransferase [Candidatus Saganbacteria bacterium]
MDYKKLRQEMANTQLIPRGIKNQRVLEAFSKIPRERFVPANLQSAAYDDCALPIGKNQTISQPYMVAIMTELLDLQGNETILEVGTGSGYQAAILAELCKKVYSIERIETLAKPAEKVIKELGYNNIEFVVGDGTNGYPQSAPYAGIIVTAGCPEIPQPLIDQLKDQGRLVIPVGSRYQQILTLVKKEGPEINIEESVGCVFVPLLGKFGWK